VFKKICKTNSNASSFAAESICAARPKRKSKKLTPFYTSTPAYTKSRIEEQTVILDALPITHWPHGVTEFLTGGNYRGVACGSETSAHLAAWPAPKNIQKVPFLLQSSLPTAPNQGLTGKTPPLLSLRQTVTCWKLAQP
jgi:hypothetical protein